MADSKNIAAFLKAEKAHPFVLTAAPYPDPGPNDVVVETKAVAANPIDAMIQAKAFMPIPYPTILGMDLAGVVAEVGGEVQHLAKGDRVIAPLGGCLFGASAQSAFQKYALCPASGTVPIPDSLSFEQATVLPACYLTAACAFYEKGLLELQPPSLTPQANGQTLFIWGGSSAVGSNAIQLAKAAGYEVAVTASARNFQYCQGLGADLVFDYTKTDAISEIIAGLKEKKLAGFFDTINLDTPQYTVQVVEELLGKGKVVSVLPGTEKHSTTNVTVIGLNSVPFVHKEEARFPVTDFFPKALAAGKFQAKPEPLVVGKGLENVQLLVDKLSEPVSARKLVLSI